MKKSRLMPIFVCTWSVLGKDGHPLTYFDKKTQKTKLRRYTDSFNDYTRAGALRQLREKHGNDIVKVNCQKFNIPSE
jgi:hypothetical protein